MEAQQENLAAQAALKRIIEQANIKNKKEKKPKNKKPRKKTGLPPRCTIRQIEEKDYFKSWYSNSYTHNIMKEDLNMWNHEGYFYNGMPLFINKRWNDYGEDYWGYAGENGYEVKVEFI